MFESIFLHQNLYNKKGYKEALEFALIWLARST